MIQHITLWEPRYNGGFTNAELTGNTYLSGTLVRKPQNMLASLWSDWFSPLYLPGRLRFGGALNQLRLEGHQVWEADVARLSPLRGCLKSPHSCKDYDGRVQNVSGNRPDRIQPHARSIGETTTF